MSENLVPIPLSPVNQRRLDHVMKWYAPARFGLFYHFGLFTGGGNASSSPKQNKTLRYASPAEFELIRNRFSGARTPARLPVRVRTQTG